jgi:hypothetical protein
MSVEKSFVIKEGFNRYICEEVSSSGSEKKTYLDFDEMMDNIALHFHKINFGERYKQRKSI